ncbi:MAG: LacI family transcriptional regulator [Lentisphaerae bacterium]|nr:LacI family transcriptional regulator [Lentisphaerota bacterium]
MAGNGQRATLRTVAERLGISVSTVSRALSGQGGRYRIRPETVGAVRAAAADLQFRPDPVARGLRMRRTHSLGLVVPDAANPFFAEIAASVADAARLRGHAVLLCDSRETTEREAEAVRLLMDRKVDGLIVCPVGLRADHLEACRAGGLPVVVADRIVGSPPLPFVAADNAAGGRMAAAYLVKRGHRRIGLLQGLPGSTPNEERKTAFLAELARHGIPRRLVPVAGEEFSEAAGAGAASALLDRHPGLTALFALSNVVAMGALRVLAARGISVPRDLSILGFDDHPYAALLATPLTVIAQPVEDLGRRAAETLFDRIEGRAPSRARAAVRLPVRLVERASVAAQPPDATKGTRP